MNQNHMLHNIQSELKNVILTTETTKMNRSIKVKHHNENQVVKFICHPLMKLILQYNTERWLNLATSNNISFYW